MYPDPVDLWEHQEAQGLRDSQDLEERPESPDSQVNLDHVDFPDLWDHPDWMATKA